MEEPKTFYGVKIVKPNIIVSVAGVGKKLKLSFAKGMVGAMPIFDTIENAQLFADGKAGLFEIKVPVEQAHKFNLEE